MNACQIIEEALEGARVAAVLSQADETTILLDSGHVLRAYVFKIEFADTSQSDN
jgi:hypothetical protein